MELRKRSKEEHYQENQPVRSRSTHKKIRIRLIPIWLRLILVAVAVVCATIIGSVVGYSVIGDGKPSEVFHKDTWIHIRDLVVKE